MSQQDFDIFITVVFTTVFTLILSVFFVVLVYRYQSRLKKKQKELFRAVMQAQEEERKRVAMDIHDGLGGLLSSGKLLLAEIKEGKLDYEEIEEHVRRAHDLVTQAIQEARNASNALLPDSIKRFGLKGAINELKQTYSSKFEMELTNDCPVGLVDLMEINIYRLLNEMLHNAAKYSGSEKVSLYVAEKNDMLHISFHDHGKGFDYHQAIEANKGNGLRNMMTRVKLLNGNLHFSHDQGARYHMEFNIRHFRK